MVKGVIFDLDGTILDSLAALWRSFNAGVAAFKLPPVPQEKLMGLMSRGIALASIIGRIYPELAAESAAGQLRNIMASIRVEYLALCSTEVKLKRGALELLQAVRDRGLKTGVVTSRTVIAEKMWPEFERLHITRFIDAVVTGSELRRKPAPDTVIDCLKKLALSPAECVMVGDSQADIQAGKAAGVKTVAIATGVSDWKELAAESPDFVFDDLPGLTQDLDLVLGGQRSAMDNCQAVFLFAAKAGALEGYLFKRRKPEPLADWIGNITSLYHALPPESKKQVDAEFAVVLEKTLKYGKSILEPELKVKLEQLLQEAKS